MGEQPGQEQEQGFRSQLFGFKKDEVLNYIDRLQADAQAREEAKAQALQAAEAARAAAVAKLVEKLETAQQENTSILEKTQTLYDQLMAEKDRNEKLAEKHHKLAENLRQLQSKAMFREQELRNLQTEKQVLAGQMDEMAQKVQQADEKEKEIGQVLVGARKTARETLEAADAQARQQKEELAAESVAVGKSVNAFRRELAQVEDQIDHAFAALKQAAAQIEQAADKMDIQLGAMGVQVDTLLESSGMAPTAPPSDVEAMRQAVAKYRVASRSVRRPRQGSLQDNLLNRISRLLRLDERSGQ